MATLIVSGIVVLLIICVVSDIIKNRGCCVPRSCNGCAAPKDFTVNDERRCALIIAPLTVPR